jgi:hypothetical protein
MIYKMDSKRGQMMASIRVDRDRITLHKLRWMGEVPEYEHLWKEADDATDQERIEANAEGEKP